MTQTKSTTTGKSKNVRLGRIRGVLPVAQRKRDPRRRARVLEYEDLTAAQQAIVQGGKTAAEPVPMDLPDYELREFFLNMMKPRAKTSG